MPTLEMIPPRLMFEMLTKHRETFAFYAKNHRAKVSPLRQRRHQTKADSPSDQRLVQQIAETIAKAEANEKLVKEIDALIGKPTTETVRSPDVCPSHPMPVASKIE